MRKNIVAGNWKMNKTLQEGIALAKELNEALAADKPNCDVVIWSPAFIERTLDKSVIIDEKKLIEYVCVAQLDRALGYGPRCREFESSRARI